MLLLRIRSDISSLPNQYLRVYYPNPVMNRDIQYQNFIFHYSRLDLFTGYLEWHCYLSAQRQIQVSKIMKRWNYLIYDFFQYVIVYQCSKIKYYNTKWPSLSLKQNSPDKEEINVKRAILSSTNSSGVYKFNSRNSALSRMVSIFKKTLNLASKSQTKFRVLLRALKQLKIFSVRYFEMYWHGRRGSL